MLGSRATHVVERVSAGIGGRALKAGDLIPLQSRSPASRAGRSRVPPVRPRDGRRPAARAARAAGRFFRARAVETLQRTRFTITAESDRMGYRLAGRARVERDRSRR